MKVLILLIFTSLLFSQELGSIQIEIKNIESSKGNLRIALSNSESTFLTDSPYKTKILEISVEKNICEFDSLDYGEYAVQLFHDEDKDGELNTNFIGIPTEPYAFSNNAKGSFGPPNYEDAKFVLDSNIITIELILNN